MNENTNDRDFHNEMYLHLEMADAISGSGEFYSLVESYIAAWKASGAWGDQEWSRSRSMMFLFTVREDVFRFLLDEGFIKDTPNRQYLWAAQTPQGFLVDSLKKAHKMANDKNFIVTDDASLFEMLNWKVKIIEGNYSNIKVTSPIDLKIAKLFLKDFYT